MKTRIHPLPRSHPTRRSAQTPEMGHPARVGTCAHEEQASCPWGEQINIVHNGDRTPRRDCTHLRCADDTQEWNSFRRRKCHAKTKPHRKAPARPLAMLAWIQLGFLALALAVPSMGAKATDVDSHLQRLPAGVVSALVHRGDNLLHPPTGTRPDPRAAYDLYLRAYYARSGAAAIRLARLFEEGEHVPRHRTLSLALLLLVSVHEVNDRPSQEAAWWCLEDLVSRVSIEELFDGLSLTQPYLNEILRLRGIESPETAALKRAPSHPSVRALVQIHTQDVRVAFESPTHP